MNKDVIEESILRNYRLFVTAGPKKPFSASEIEIIREFVFESAKSVLIMLGELLTEPKLKH